MLSRRCRWFWADPMNIHEYQAKELLAKFGVAVPRGGVAYTARRGGRGSAPARRAGLGGQGADPCRRPRQGRRESSSSAPRRRSPPRRSALLGHNLVTHQTGPAGREVKRVYVEEGCDISRELYLGLLIDRETGRVTLIGLDRGRGRDRGGAPSIRPRKSSRSRSTRRAASSRSTPARSPMAWASKASRSVSRSSS